MTTHDFRPAGAAPRPRVGPRSGRADSARGPRGAARAVLVAASVGTLLGLGPTHASADELRPTIVFTSTRDNLTQPGLRGAEIYLMNPDPDPKKQKLRQLTTNVAADGFAVLSPDGKQIVFESNRNRVVPTEPANTSDLFLMKTDGTLQRLLTRGSSATW